MAKAYPTQNFVPIKEIRDGIIVLKDGSLRTLVSVQAINMALKSTEEQEAVIYQFQNFLNQLEFSLQIVSQSRRFDIKPYLLTLEKRLGEQQEELLRIQTREYIEFIRWFSEHQNIMSKEFYIVIPYSFSSIGSQNSTFMDRITGIFSPTSKKTRNRLEKFEEQRSQIEQRVTIVRSGLSRLGVRSEQLNTEQSIEKFYEIFNPGEEQRSIPQ